jgi:hypothetical protein
MNMTTTNFTNMIGGIQKVPTAGTANMNKTAANGFEFTQKFEKSELAGLLAQSNKGPQRKKHENE